MFEPVSTRNLTSTPLPLLECIQVVLADLHFHAECQLLDTGAIDNDAGPNLGPLVQPSIISVVVTEICAIIQKIPRLTTAPTSPSTDIYWDPQANMLRSR